MKAIAVFAIALSLSLTFSSQFLFAEAEFVTLRSVPVFNGTQNTLEFQTRQGTVYQVQFADSIPFEWHDQGALIYGNGFKFSFSDTVPNSMGFYRMVQMPLDSFQVQDQDSKPPVIGRFEINEGLGVTYSPQVTLDILAYDTGSTITEMAISTDGVTFTEPRPFHPSSAWNLADGYGEKKVWIKLKDAHGHWSDAASAKIQFQTAGVTEKLLTNFEGLQDIPFIYFDIDSIHTRTLTEEKAYDGTHSMKMEYQKRAGLPYSFFSLSPPQNGTDNNFLGFQTFRFQLSNGSPRPISIIVKFEFGDGGTFEREIYFYEGSQWQEAVVDLSSLSETRLRNISRILFFVEPTNTTNGGHFYIDNIQLGPRPATQVLDDYEGNSRLIQTYWDVNGTEVYTRTIDSEQSSQGRHAMKIEYHKSTDYATSFFAIEPLQDGIANDLSSFNAFKLYVTKESLPSMRLMMKFELEDTQINFESWKVIPQGPTGWTELVFDFSSVNPDILKKVRNILFFVDPYFFTTPEETQGVFWIDNLRLTYDPSLKAAVFNDTQAPQIGWIASSVASDVNNEYHVGSLVRINAWEFNGASDLTDGKIRIVSKSTGYDSGERTIVFTHDGQFWPFHWDTTGLKAADDYEVTITLKDVLGNATVSGTANQPSLTIQLTEGVPNLGELVSVRNFSIPFGAIALSFGRRYDAVDPTVFDRPLGLGWHFSLDYFVQDFPDGTASASLGDAGYEFFFRNADGTYRPKLAGSDWALKKLAQGFELRHQNGTVYALASAPFVDYNTRTSVTWYLTRIIDRNRNQTSCTYDSNRNMTGITGSGGEPIQLFYSFRNRDQFNTDKYKLDKIVDQAGRTWEFTHDAHGHLLSEKNPLQEITRYEYDSLSRLTRIIYPDTSTQSYEYDSESRVTKMLRNDVLQQEFIFGGRNDRSFIVKDAEGHPTKVTLSPEGYPIEFVDAQGGKTQFLYDSKGNVTKRIDAQSNIFAYHYDSQGNLADTTDPLGKIRRFEYDSVLNLITRYKNSLGEQTQFIRDPHGNATQSLDAGSFKTEYAYDIRGNLISVTDAEQDTTRYTHDASGRIRTLTDSEGKVTEYEYDLAGNLIQMMDAEKGVWKYQYDLLGRLTKEIDALGYNTQYNYDSMGRLTQVKDTLDQTESYEYDLFGRITAKIDVRGKGTEYFYDDKGNLVGVLNPLLEETRYDYDSLSRLEEIHDPLDHVTYYAYDKLGQLVSKTDPSGNVTRYEYDPRGLLLKTVDPSQGVFVNTYDDLGRLETETDALGGKTEYDYDARGNLTRITDALKHSRDFTYDKANRLLSERDAEGNVTHYKYDGLGRLKKTLYPDQAEEAIFYDGFGRVIQETDGEGRHVFYIFDTAGNLKEINDTAGNLTRYEYDTLNRTISVTNALDKAIHYRYDQTAVLTNILDERQNATAMKYDDLGRLSETLYPDTGKETYAYDKAGNLRSFTDRMQRIIRHHYDASHRVTEIQYPDSTKESFTYDEMENRKTAASTTGTLHYEYDLLGRVKKETDVFGNVLSYTYDELGNRQSVQAVISGTVLKRDYSYDGLGRLSEIKDEKSRKTTYGYDSRSRVTSKTLPNAVKTEWVYNLASEVRGMSYTHTASGYSLGNLIYTYDSRGLLHEKLDSKRGVTSFEYDRLGQLISITDPMIGLTVFMLDEAGNRSSVIDSSGTSDYLANSMNEYTKCGLEFFQYNANGAMIERSYIFSSSTYQYDAKDHLIGAEAKTGLIAPGQRTIRYAYDLFGRRISKTVNGVTTRYVWDGDELFAEMDESGRLLKSYVYGQDIDEVLYQNDHVKNETLYFLQDELGSTLALTDERGEIKESFTYDAYGNLTGSPAKPTTNLLYTGREFDPETGLYYNRARYYDPGLGRFISPDPIGFAGGLNLYTYARNNPVRYRDPWGLDPYWAGDGFEDSIDIEFPPDFEPVNIPGHEVGPFSADRWGLSGQSGGGEIYWKLPDSFGRPAQNDVFQPPVYIPGGKVGDRPADRPAGAEPNPFLFNPLGGGGGFLPPPFGGGGPVPGIGVPIPVPGIAPGYPAPGLKGDYLAKGKKDDKKGKKETPTTHKGKFRPIRGRPAKQHTKTGEVFEKDKSRHGGEHYEVYKNLRDYNKGDRWMSVGEDGTPIRVYNP